MLRGNRRTDIQIVEAVTDACAPLIRLDSDHGRRRGRLAVDEHVRCHGEQSNKEGLKMKTFITVFPLGFFLH